MMEGEKSGIKRKRGENERDGDKNEGPKGEKERLKRWRRMRKSRKTRKEWARELYEQMRKRKRKITRK